MSDRYKCMASQEGICRNVHAFGVKCNGYSEKCRLRPHYNNIENACKGTIDSIRRAFGIVGDKE